MAGSNAVFISYRRHVSPSLAAALRQQLEDAGIDAFCHLDSSPTGRFEEIVDQIESRPYFVLVLTPGTLDRCTEPGDGLRREIEHAVATGRRIVLGHSPEFEFVDFERFVPPETGRELRRWPTQELPDRWFNYAVRELIEEFLVPIQDGTTQPTHKADRSEATPVRAPAGSVLDLTAEQFRAAMQHTERGGHLSARGEHQAAIAEYTRAVTYNPYSVVAFVNRGAQRNLIGEYEAAIADFDRAIELDPNRAEPFINRGDARRALGHLETAMADLDRAIELDPDNAIALNNRGNAHTALGHYSTAIADLDRAIELDPDNPEAFNNRGYAHSELGDHTAAIADYTRAIDHDLNVAIVYYNRGLSRARTPDLVGALADFRRAIELDPHNTAGVASAARSELKRLGA